MVNPLAFEWSPGSEEERKVVDQRRTSDRESASKDVMERDSRRADDRGRHA